MGLGWSQPILRKSTFITSQSSSALLREHYKVVMFLWRLRRVQSQATIAEQESCIVRKAMMSTSRTTTENGALSNLHGFASFSAVTLC